MLSHSGETVRMTLAQADFIEVQTELDLAQKGFEAAKLRLHTASTEFRGHWDNMTQAEQDNVNAIYGKKREDANTERE